MNKIFCIALLCFINYSIADAQTHKTIDQRIDSLFKIMTLEEKIGQLSQYSGKALTGPNGASLTVALEKGLVGSILNISGAKQLRALQEKAFASSRIKIPLLFGSDVIHGFKTIFPVPLAESCSWDLAAMGTSAKIAAIEASASGVNWTFAPMVDIGRDPRWGRVVEGAGEDTYLGSQIAKARIKGFQWNLGGNNSVMACAKHFAAYGLPQAGKDYGPVDMSDQTLHDIYLPPFQAAADAGVATFMTSFNEINGVPSTANKYLLKDLLANQWGFRGFVVSDWNAVIQLTSQGVAKDKKQATELAFNAGTDMDMTDGVYIEYLPALIREHKVSEKMVDDAVRRILRYKFRLGLFDDPYRFFDENREKLSQLSKAHLDTARSIARKAIVLLKNERQTLPISKTKNTIAVIGPLADTRTELFGSWYAKGDTTYAVTLMQGIKNKLGNAVKLNYAKGCNIDDQDTTGFADAVKAASVSDEIIVALGESGSMSGEGKSRSNLELPGVQNQLIKALATTGKPITVVLMNGRPLTFNWISENIPAILETWYLGTEAGNAIADILFGDYNPSGKLTISFPRALGQVPIYYNHKISGRPANVDGPANTGGYANRFMDLKEGAQYPFGFGLSYTTFKYDNIHVGAKFVRSKPLTASVRVINAGKMAGEEIVQLYVRDLVGSLTRPIKELKGFKKIYLRPGETQTVTFKINAADLGFYGTNLKYVTEPGEFDIMIGSSSEKFLSAKTILEN